MRTVRLGEALSRPGQQGLSVPSQGRPRLVLLVLKGTRLSGWRELSEWSRQRNTGDGAAAGIVRSSATCSLQEGRQRGQPRRAGGGLRWGNEQ